MNGKQYLSGLDTGSYPIKTTNLRFIKNAPMKDNLHNNEK
jgi:hypothetical protein